jgi:hypothetical protein
VILRSLPSAFNRIHRQFIAANYRGGTEWKRAEEEAMSESFEFLRRSNPAAAFDMLVRDFLSAVEDDTELAEAFASYQKHLNGPINTTEDARRLAALKEQGAEDLNITVGTLPFAMSAGLAFMYDVAVEALRSSDTRLHPNMFSPRAVGTAERLLDLALLQIGSSTVTALELAMADSAYADRLRERAGEIGWVARQPPDPVGPCEFCTVTITDAEGVPHITCPSKEDCETIGGIVLVLILILLIYELLDWIFG